MEIALDMVEKEMSPMMGSNYFYLLKLDKNGNVLETNHKLNYQPSIFEGSFVGQSFGEILFPKDFISFQNSLQKTLGKKDKNFQLDLRKVNDDASDFHWTHWEFTIEQKNESDYTVLGIGHDILKNNEKTIEFPDFIYEHQIKNEIMEGLFEDNLIGFWIWDLENKSDILSVSLRTMLGYDLISNDITEVKWKKHIHPQDREKSNQQLEDHFTSYGKIPFHSELRIITISGKEIWSIAYGKVIKWNDAGLPLNMVGCFFDISEKKKSEIILERQNQFLKELTFNQSHMMRSKLANILGVLEVMEPKNNINEITEYLQLLKEEASKLDRALQDSIHSSSALNFKK
ncbi:PAS domain-containing protein [Belliella marina]|uniref:histidine kinase n=1 Tax=Belliella marina TaxID=1644146 RepID=A0ABW4VSL7_9BACT